MDVCIVNITCTTEILLKFVLLGEAQDGGPGDGGGGEGGRTCWLYFLIMLNESIPLDMLIKSNSLAGSTYIYSAHSSPLQDISFSKARHHCYHTISCNCFCLSIRMFYKWISISKKKKIYINLIWKFSVSK